MLVALAFAALGSQTLGPTLPPSCRPAFQATVLSIEQALQDQDFAKANERVKFLPDRAMSFDWDDSKVPAAYRDRFRECAKAAFALWNAKVPGLTFTFKTNANIRISFEPVLAENPETHLPRARVGFVREDPTGPRLDFVIGLKRGSPPKTTEETDVFDDIVYGVGMYLGVADGVFDTYAMSLTDLPRSSRVTVSGTEAITARRNMEIVGELQFAVKKQLPMIAAKSELFIDPLILEGEPAIQGDRVQFNIQLSNRGNAPLAYSLFPDCGCTVVTEPGTVNPQSSRLVAVAVDTRLFTHDTTKHVTVYTNDPTNPVRLVTLKVHIKPRFRLITPLGDTVAVPKAGMKYPVYLIPAKGTDMEPVSIKFDSPGMKATVTWARWQGVLADPEVNEGPAARKGYKFLIDIKGSIASGRNPGTLQIYTSNADFPDITVNLYGQRGIIAVPDEVVVGEVGRVPRTITFLLLGATHPFKVLGVSTNSENLKATAVRVPGKNDYSIVVQYDGKGRAGDLMAAVRVRTNDPEQPLIDVPIRASIQ